MKNTYQDLIMKHILRDMNKADKYLLETLKEIVKSPYTDVDPRPKYKDGTPAHTKFITQKQYVYDISKGEFPINTLRKTAIKGGWYDIEAIYQKQTNIIEEMNPAIHSWWEDFVVDKSYRYAEGEVNQSIGCDESYKQEAIDRGLTPILHQSFIGQTYGHTVKRYDLMNKLLKGIQSNPFGRRHMINLWQEQQMIEDPKALVPCAYETLWTPRDEVYLGQEFTRFVDMTLNQRSMDYLMTSSINPTQYVMFGMAVCGHLTFHTGIEHRLGVFTHNVQNVHIYDRHEWAVDEILTRKPSDVTPKIELLAIKDFYDYIIDDFKITVPKIEKLSKELELAI